MVNKFIKITTVLLFFVAVNINGQNQDHLDSALNAGQRSIIIIASLTAKGETVWLKEVTDETYLAK